MFPAGYGGAIGAAKEPFSTVVNEIKITLLNFQILTLELEFGCLENTKK